MKKEVTFVICDQCEAELSRSDEHWEGKDHRAHRDYWQFESHTFCGETCARSYFEARIAEYQAERFRPRVSAA